MVLLLVAPSDSRNAALRKSTGGNPLFDGTLTCMIDTRDDMLNRSELRAGLNYELLKMFAEDHHCPVSVRLALRGENPVDSLILGAVDILVTDADSTENDAIRRSRNVGRHCAWYVREDADAELRDINLWICSLAGTKEYKDLRARFNVNYSPYTRTARGITSTRISPYDDLIRKYAGMLGWDWRLLAAVIYQESKFAINTVSRRGAVGLMQIMPATAERYGVTDLLDPEQNLLAGTSFLAGIQRGFPEEEFSAEERVNFTLAAYNAGEGRIRDCRLFAGARGVDSTKWEEIVKVIPEMGEYTIESPDSTVVRTGRFRGKETVNYVYQVLDLYDMFCDICPQR